MSGTGASNLGYGGEYPSSDVNPLLVNVGNSHNPANFSSTVIPNSCASFRGGGKGRSFTQTMKRKIKSLIKGYRMKGSRRKLLSLKRKIRSKYLSKRRGSRMRGKSRRRHHRRSKSQRGGYAQYTPAGNSGYSVGGDAGPSGIFANPPPISPNTGSNSNCFTAYKH
jgi:hypothetical protein